MDLKLINEINPELGNLLEEFHQEYLGILSKWMMKSPQTAIIGFVNFPLNAIMQLILSDEEQQLVELLPDLPDIFIRFMFPFTEIKDKWGKVSNEEFCKLYDEHYERQFDNRS